MNWLWRRSVDGSAYMDTVKNLGRIPDKPFREAIQVRRCDTCKWFARARFDGHVCRRHAPIECVKDGITDYAWPSVDATDYCGDWEAQ